MRNYIQELQNSKRHGKTAHNSVLAAQGIACILGSPLAARRGLYRVFRRNRLCLSKNGCGRLLLRIPSNSASRRGFWLGAGFFGSLGYGAKGFIDLATQKPLTSDEQKQFFVNLANLQSDMVWKRMIIDRIIDQYKPSWLQSEASAKLMETLNSEHSVDFKFNKINEYVLDHIYKFSINNGRKLFCTIQRAVEEVANLAAGEKDLTLATTEAQIMEYKALN